MSPASVPTADSLLPGAHISAHGKYVSLGLTLAVHLMLFAFLFFGVRWSTQVNDAVEVELVRAVPETPVAAPAPPPPVVEPKPVPPVVPRVEPKPPAPLAKPDIALKEEKKEKPKPKPVPPAPQVPQADPFQKQLEQELKRTSADRQRAEASSAAAKELDEVRAAQASAARSKAMADYTGKIKAKIKGNIILPADIKGNPEAIFEVVQVPSGEILSVRLKKTSGHAGYDAAVERAILKSSPLPKPERGDLFARDLTLKFHPLED